MKNRIAMIISSFTLLSALAFVGVASAQTTQQMNWGGGQGSGTHMPGVFGTVSAVSGDTLTVSSKGYGQNATATTYTVDASGATVTKDGASSSVGDIAVGDTVMVQGTVSGDSVTATSIRDGMMQGGRGGMMGHPGIFGTVSAINGTTLSVTSKAMVGPNASSGTATTYTVDASNATVMKDNATSTLSAIAVGDTVMVQGTVSGDSVTATTIRDGVVPMMGQGQPAFQGNGEPVVGGSVSGINGSSLTITNSSNVTYTVDASNATVMKGNATSSLSSVAVGDSVLVQGTVEGNAVTASTVIDQGTTPAAGSKPAMHGMAGVFGAIGGFFQHLFGFF